jgi:hypothetical protein
LDLQIDLQLTDDTVDKSIYENGKEDLKKIKYKKGEMEFP